jgi:hypothetical protein
VEDLERGRGPDDRGEFPVPDVVGERFDRSILLADGVPAPIAKQCPESLATAQQFARLVDERGELARYRFEERRSVVEEFIDTSLYQVN